MGEKPKVPKVASKPIYLMTTEEFWRWWGIVPQIKRVV
jgi:hypothetical protein